MAELEQKYYHFAMKAAFDSALADGTLTNDKIAFIKETKQIWTHGQLYDCKELDWANITNKPYIDSKIRLMTGSGAAEITTAQFITKLTDLGLFTQRFGVVRGSFEYGYNDTITDSGIENIPLYGAVVEVFGQTGQYTIRVTTTSTVLNGNGTAKHQYMYFYNGDNYSPGWVKVANSTDLANYLPLTGGELSGSLKVNGVVESTEYVISNKSIQYSASATANIFTDFRNVIFGNTDTNNAKLKVVRAGNNSTMGTPPTGYNAIIGGYVPILVFSQMDTHGFIAIKQQASNPRVQVGGGSGQNINWTADLVHSINVGDYALPISGGTVTDQVKFRHGANRTTPQVVIGGDSNNTIASLGFDTTDGKSAWQFSLRNRASDSKELMLYRGANWANQWRIDYATGKMIQYGDLEVRGNITANNLSAAAIPVEYVTTTSQALTPNKKYVWKKAPATLTLTLVAATDDTIVNEYMAQFPIYDTTVNLPSGISWAGGVAPTYKNNSIYRISIIDKMAEWKEFAGLYVHPEFTVSGFYKVGTSNNKSVYSTTGAGIATINIVGYDTFTIYVRHSNGYNDNVENEGEHDYMVVGNLDATITASSVTGSTGVKYTTQGNDTPEGAVDDYDTSYYQAVTFSGIGGGSHKIMVSYHKDSQFNVGEDTGYILIPEQ